MQQSNIAQWNDTNVIADDDSLRTRHNWRLSTFNLVLHRGPLEFQPIHMKPTDELIWVYQIDKFRVFQSFQFSLSNRWDGESCPFECFHIPFDWSQRTFKFIVHVRVHIPHTIRQLLQRSQLSLDISADGYLTSICHTTNPSSAIHHRAEIIHSSGNWIDFAYWISPMTTHSDRQPSM